MEARRYEGSRNGAPNLPLAKRPAQRNRLGARGQAPLPLVLATLAALSCGDVATGPAAPPPPPPPPPVASSVEVAPATALLEALGDTVRLAATVRDQRGQAMPGASVSWSSSADAVASVSSAGVVCAVAAGVATITARSGNASGEAAVTVRQAAASVEVEPASLLFAAVGDTARLAARVRDRNGHPVGGAQVA